MQGEEIVEIAAKSEDGRSWTLGSKKVPRAEIVFFSQLFIITLVVITGLVNLCLSNGSEAFWSSLVSLGLASVLPRAKIKKDGGGTKGNLLQP